MTNWADVENDSNARKVLDKGFVVLLETMGSDKAVVDAARISYGSGTRAISDDRNLIRYMMRNHHTSPFEMCELKFLIKLPIFVMRQHIRHRTACLSGNTILDFDLGGNTSSKIELARHPLSVKNIYERWMYGSFGNKRNDYDLSFIDQNKYYCANQVGIWFKNRADKCKAFAVTMKAKNNKMIDHYQGKDIISFYENEKAIGFNHQRNILRNMRLRSFDEKTKSLIYTTITNIWKTGEKEVFELIVGDGNKLDRKISASKDHLFFTEYGWMKLEDIHVGDKVWCISSSNQTNRIDIPPVIDTDSEKWVPCYGWEDSYEVSSYGRVKRIKASQGAVRGRIKTLTCSKPYLVVGLNDKQSKQDKTFLIHRLVLQSFTRVSGEKQFACHRNGNPLDNRIENLYWGTAQDNADDSCNHGTRTQLSGILRTVISKKSTGVEETYDIEVSGPYHNFSANGFIVHNSVNEVSARYSVIDEEFYLPEKSRIQAQSTSNNQGSGDLLSEEDQDEIQEIFKESYEQSYRAYEKGIRKNLSRELARLSLPVAAYTECYWKIDLNNFFKYIRLRDDSHAQSEIQEYARAMEDLAKDKFPLSFEAFNDYQKNSISFSLPEQRLLHVYISNAGQIDKPDELTEREWKEFRMKLNEISQRK